MIAIIHTGGANLASVKNALTRLGADAELTDDPARIRAATHVILPGVGAARDAMAKLRAARLVEVIQNLTQPVLGICLGMQLFFTHSREGDVPCLGLLQGTVEAIEPDVANGVTVPHMGWNALTPCGEETALFTGTLGQYFYFVHSYKAPTGSFVRATTEHGGAIVAALAHQNFFGVQFHPERSGENGARLLERFVQL